MNFFQLKDEYGQEHGDKDNEESYHPMANIETYMDGLTAEQRASLSDDDIFYHFAKLGYIYGFQRFGWNLVHNFAKTVLGLTVIFKPELSLTERCIWMIKQAKDLIKACGSKQNVQQLFKGMRNDEINGDVWEQYLTTESGNIKPKKNNKLKGVLKPRGKEIQDRQMRLIDDEGFDESGVYKKHVHSDENAKPSQFNKTMYGEDA